MTQRETFLTSEGLSRLEVELEHLRTVRRQEVAQRIQGAKGVGGTVDNADYEEAKNEQAFVEYIKKPYFGRPYSNFESNKFLNNKMDNSSLNSAIRRWFRNIYE